MVGGIVAHDNIILKIQPSESESKFYESINTKNIP